MTRTPVHSLTCIPSRCTAGFSVARSRDWVETPVPTSCRLSRPKPSTYRAGHWLGGLGAGPDDGPAQCQHRRCQCPMAGADDATLSLAPPGCGGVTPQPEVRVVLQATLSAPGAAKYSTARQKSESFDATRQTSNRRPGARAESPDGRGTISYSELPEVRSGGWAGTTLASSFRVSPESSYIY